MFVFWLPISFESAAQVSQTVSQKENTNIFDSYCVWIVTGAKEELSYTDFEVRLTWAKLTCPSFDSFRLACFLLLSSHVSELGLNLSSAQLDSRRFISFLVILDDVWHTFLLHNTAILQRIPSIPGLLGHVSVRLWSNETKTKRKEWAKKTTVTK